MTQNISRFASELADREAIRDCISRYARAIDRIDETLLRSIYWEDAENDAVVYAGPADEFIGFIIPVMQSIDRTAHLLGSPLIEIDGASAVVETYLFALTRIPNEAGVLQDHFTGGRYIDLFERRDGEWRILRRKLVIDWYRDTPDAADWSNGFRGTPTQPGARKPDDALYRVLDSRRHK